MKSAIWFRTEVWVEDRQRFGFAVSPGALENVFLTRSQLSTGHVLGQFKIELKSWLWVPRSRRPMILMTGVPASDSQLGGPSVLEEHLT